VWQVGPTRALSAFGVGLGCVRGGRGQDRLENQIERSQTGINQSQRHACAPHTFPKSYPLMSFLEKLRLVVVTRRACSTTPCTHTPTPTTTLAYTPLQLSAVSEVLLELGDEAGQGGNTLACVSRHGQRLRLPRTIPGQAAGGGGGG